MVKPVKAKASIKADEEGILATCACTCEAPLSYLWLPPSFFIIASLFHHSNDHFLDKSDFEVFLLENRKSMTESILSLKINQLN